MITVRQIRSEDGTGTLSYLIFSKEPGAGLIIDPNHEDLGRIKEMITMEGIRPTHVIDTHTHVDHVSAAGELSKQYGASVVMHENTVNKWKVVDQGDRFGIGETLRANAAIAVDEFVKDGDVVVSGVITARVLFTPGHTDNHVALVIGDNVFTGDLLLIGQAGRSDLPGGDAGEQYESLMGKILPLPDHYRMYPGHDYADNEYALLGEEKDTNPFLRKRTKEEYVEFVKDFFPPIAEASASGGKMTLQCGTQRVLQDTDDLRAIDASNLSDILEGGDHIFLVDVRQPVELDRFGAIPGAVNIPVGELAARMNELPQDKGTSIVCVCQSGSRSMEAAHYLQRQGYNNIRNLTGGTSSWVANGYPVVRGVKTGAGR